jgi:hypothetical protein
MEPHEITSLMLDIERSIQMRQQLNERLSRNEAVDLVAAWKEMEQLDMEIAGTIRKRPIE